MFGRKRKSSEDCDSLNSSIIKETERLDVINYKILTDIYGKIQAHVQGRKYLERDTVNEYWQDVKEMIVVNPQFATYRAKIEKFLGTIHQEFIRDVQDVVTSKVVSIEDSLLTQKSQSKSLNEFPLDLLTDDTFITIKESGSNSTLNECYDVSLGSGEFKIPQSPPKRSKTKQNTFQKNISLISIEDDDQMLVAGTQHVKSKKKSEVKTYLKFKNTIKPSIKPIENTKKLKSSKDDFVQEKNQSRVRTYLEKKKNFLDNLETSTSELKTSENSLETQDAGSLLDHDSDTEDEDDSKSEIFEISIGNRETGKKYASQIWKQQSESFGEGLGPTQDFSASEDFSRTFNTTDNTIVALSTAYERVESGLSQRETTNETVDLNLTDVSGLTGNLGNLTVDDDDKKKETAITIPDNIPEEYHDNYRAIVGYCEDLKKFYKPKIETPKVETAASRMERFMELVQIVTELKEEEMAARNSSPKENPE